MKSADITFETLHSELIGRICQYLDDTHPPSLLAFALVNSDSYAIASSRLFRTIKFTVSDGQQLVKNVERRGTLLRRDDGFRHVRRLIIYWAENKDERRDGYASLHPCERYEDDSGLQTCWDLSHCKPRPFSETPMMDGHWEIVARLVKQLTGLLDIFYAFPEQIPECVLQVLHTRLPLCRLHDYTFHLESLERESIDPHEMALSTSPCLYSIGKVNLETERVVWDFVRQQASRLRAAHVWLPRAAAGATGFDDEDGALHGVEISQQLPTPLEIFHLTKPIFREGPLSFGSIHRAMYGDFSALRVLKLEWPILSLDALPVPSQFSALVTLAFTCATDPSPDYWGTLLLFLHGLPRLTTLQLRDWKRSVSVVPGLSPNLRKLDFATLIEVTTDLLKDDHIHRLPDLCPDLEDLTLEVRRSRGTVDEVSRYHALGCLRRLQYLTIQPDASPPGLDRTVEYLDAQGDSISYGTAIEPWFDAEDAKTLEDPLRPYRRGHVHDLLINSAIDSNLVRAIFEVINRAKAGLSGAVLPLERLEIQPAFGKKFPHTNMIRLSKISLLPFLIALRRRWFVERSVRDDERRLLRVTELDRKVGLSPSSNRLMTIRRHSEYLLNIWLHIWPAAEGGEGWWENWKSQLLDSGKI